ncbi:MAG: MFS transporter [Armatimonadota bacterium]
MAFHLSLSQPVRRALRWDAIAGTLFGLFSGAIVPFLGVIARHDLGTSPFLLAMLNSAGSVGNLLNPLIAYRIRNKPKLPHVLWPGAVGRAAFLLMMLPAAALAPVYVAICFVANAIATLGSPAYAAVVRDAYPVDRRGVLMGYVRVLSVAGSMVGSLVAGALLAHWSFRTVFPMAAAVGLLSTLAFSRIGVHAAPDDPSAAEHSLWESYRRVRGDRAFSLYTTCFYLYGIGNLILGPVIPVFQVDKLHITPLWVGYLAMTSSAFAMLGYLFWGQVLDRHGPFRLMLMVIAVVSLMPITYFFAHSVPVLLIAAAASGFGYAGGDLGYINAALRFGSRDSVASYAGMFAFFQACRGIPGPFLGAALSGVLGLRPVFLIALVFYAISVTVIIGKGGLRMKMRSD